MAEPKPPKLCEQCESEPATVRVVAADVDGTVLDSVFTCVGCLNRHGVDLTVGHPIAPFAVTDR